MSHNIKAVWYHKGSDMIYYSFKPEDNIWYQLKVFWSEADRGDIDFPEDFPDYRVVTTPYPSKNYYEPKLSWIEEQEKTKKRKVQSTMDMFMKKSCQ